jgi:hypothetical protein
MKWHGADLQYAAVMLRALGHEVGERRRVLQHALREAGRFFAYARQPHCTLLGSVA